MYLLPPLEWFLFIHVSHFPYPVTTVFFLEEIMFLPVAALFFPIAALVWMSHGCQTLFTLGFRGGDLLLKP